LKGLNRFHETRHTKNMKETGSQRINRDLIECKDALQSFKSTNQTTAEEHYDTLKRQNKMDVAYDQILTKLHKIFALSEKLESFIKNPTVDQAREIQEDCIIILFYHDVPVYYPLFKTSKYFNNFGQPCEPEYGKWTYDGKEYQMDNMITNVQNIMSWFIITLS
jgi:hypothetical protein